MAGHRDRERLRGTFEEVAELYDRARPTYPPAVFDDLVELARLPEGGRVLEVGPGTGKATVDLAARGFEIVAVELGPELAAVARRNLAPFPRAEVVTADFEEWEPGRAGFDAVVAFTAFHWLSQERRFAKPAALLRRGGTLAVLATHHVSPEGGDPVWAEVQADYDAVVPSPDNRPPPPPEEIADLRADFNATGLFREIEARRYRWDVAYTADEWVSVLATYSENIAMPPAQREALFSRIRNRIAARPGGTATRHYLAVLTVGVRP